jgi:hypothetical protein
MRFITMRAFFKHADSDPAVSMSFKETEIDMVLMAACHDFGRVAKGMPIEAQVFEAWGATLAFRRVQDAPLRRQGLLRLAIRMFPGIRSADRKTQKRIGLLALQKAKEDPSLRMEIEREVRLASQE